MSSKTLETALFSLSAGCLVIAVVEVISQGLGYAYLWLMISVALWLGYTVVKRKRMAADNTAGPGKKAVSAKATAQSDKQGRSSASNMQATRGGKNRSASKSGRNRK